MRSSILSLGLCAAVAGGAVFGFLGPGPWGGVNTAQAAGLTTAHKKDLTEMKKDLNRVAALIRQKKADEADKIVTDAEAKLKEIQEEASLKADDRVFTSINKELSSAKKAVLEHKIKAGEITAVSFAKEVAPILNAKCVSCHGNNNGRGGLSLASFVNMQKRGESGQPLLQIGNPDKSLIIERLKADDDTRMPKNGTLTAKEIETISTWILQGAKFDGKDEKAALAAVISEARGASREKVVINRPTGDETVSFVKDIAPFMVNICMRCHRGDDPRGGLSMETFEKLMQGGNSGRVVVPGDIKASRLWDLAGEQNPIKMPPGQLLITVKNHANLKKWIEEGAKFDGGDPKAPLARLVPTEEELKAQELAKLSHDDLVKMHLERDRALWKAALSKDQPAEIDGKEFILMGNVSESRLAQVQKWAEENAKQLRNMFGEKGDHLWKGKLTIFVLKDRFSYEEFATTNSRRTPPKEVTGHSVVSSSLEDVYVCLQDVGDNVTSESGGLALNLMDHMTGAFLQRASGRIPDWALRGTGLAIAARAEKNDYVLGLRKQVPDLLKSIDRPEDVFSDGQFSPASIGPIGYTLVDFLLTQGGGPKFGQFIRTVQGGTNVNEALRTVYGGTAQSIALQYGASVGSKRKK